MKYQIVVTDGAHTIDMRTKGILVSQLKKGMFVKIHVRRKGAARRRVFGRGRRGSAIPHDVFRQPIVDIELKDNICLCVIHVEEIIPVPALTKAVRKEAGTVKVLQTAYASLSRQHQSNHMTPGGYV